MKTSFPTGCLLVLAVIAPSIHAQDFTFTAIAGGSQGLADGIGINAQLYNPTGVAVDAEGNLYVADQDNNVIRKIAPSGTNWVVTTIAGGTQGSMDGFDTSAQFSGPSGIAIDNAGNLYVADQFNSIIRRIIPQGTHWLVVTLAGTPGVPGNTDGAGGAARFSSPTGIAVDGGDNVYVADEVNNNIRMITPTASNWMVTTIAGGTMGSLNIRCGGGQSGPPVCGRPI
jgi:hypothetical protein